MTQISIFRSQLHLRRLNDATLRILESILLSNDVNSLLDTRNTLRKLLRSESVLAFQEFAEKSVDCKLSALDFFVRAFALAGDVESCLALRYEALHLRERMSVNDKWLRVSYEEWLNFAKDSLDNGFYSISVKGCEKALTCVQAIEDVDSNSYIHIIDTQVVEEIKKLKDLAQTLVASHSVQAQTAEHLRNKTIQQNKVTESLPTDSRYVGSSLFRNGIKKRNMQKLREFQNLR